MIDYTCSSVFIVLPVSKYEFSLISLLVSCLLCHGLIFTEQCILFFSTDEAATENILKAELTMAALCGRLGLVTSRDAFITAICKGSLPPHYALTVLNSTTAALSSKCKYMDFSLLFKYV